MDESPVEPHGPDEDGRDQENDPTALGPLDRQLPPPDEDDDDEEDHRERRARAGGGP